MQPTKQLEIPDFDLERFAYRFKDHSAFFYAMSKVGNIVWTDRIPTACVTFSPDSYKPINLCFNPEFFSSLNEEEVMFVLGHEYLHIILNHGQRGKDFANHQLANIAFDLVINQTLCLRYGFNRQELPWLSENGCWLDTVFSKEVWWKMCPRSSGNYYYTQLEIYPPQMSEGFDGNCIPGNSGDGKGLPGKSTMTDAEATDLMDKVIAAGDETVTSEDLDTLAEIDKQCNQSRGNSPLGQELRTRSIKLRPKKKWESVIKEWVNKTLKEIFAENETWLEPNHKVSELLDSFNAKIPAERMRVEQKEKKDKIRAWFFVDMSGSQVHMAQRFINCINTIPEEHFDVRVWSFDTRVYPVDLKTGVLKGGGGTEFTIMEDEIQRIIKREGCKYPESVWVLTDGYGTHINPQIPERWYWLMTEPYRDCIPKTSHVYDLNEFE